MDIFPIHPAAINHAHGGRILTVHGISHSAGKPRDGHSTDTWFFIADVEWDDGSKSAKAEVHPAQLCVSEGDAQFSGLLSAMNQYLDSHGKWFFEGKHQGWYATERAGK